MQREGRNGIDSPSAEGEGESDGAWRWTQGLRRTLLQWLPAVLWMAVIFALSSQSDLPTPSDRTTDFVLKKSAHVAAYGLLALLLLFANRKRSRSSAIAFAITTLYAISDEFHQSLVPTRTANFADVIIDSCAAMFSLALLRWYLRWRTKRRESG